MKNRLIIAVMLLLSTLIFACKKFDQQPTSNNYFLKAQKNASAWEATQGAYFISSKTSTDTLTFFGSKGEEHLLMVVFKNKTNQYEVDLTKTNFTLRLGKM